MKTTLVTLFIVALAAPAANAGKDVIPVDNWGRYINYIQPHTATRNKVDHWTPNSRFIFLVKGYESDDVVLVQHYAGKKKWGPELKCPTSKMKIKGSDYVFVNTRSCVLENEKYAIAKAGKFKTVVGYRKLAEGKDFKDLATFNYTMEKRIDSAKNTKFFLNMDFRMGETWLHQKQDKSFLLLSWFKRGPEKETRMQRGDFKLRCFANGNKVEFQGPSGRYDYSFNDPKAKTNNGTQVAYEYQSFYFTGDARKFFAANDGDYRCVLTRFGSLDREFYFTLKGNKAIKPPCQTGDNPFVRAPESTTIVKTVWKKPTDQKFDRKAFAASAMYGRKGVPKACGWK